MNLKRIENAFNDYLGPDAGALNDTYDGFVKQLSKAEREVIQSHGETCGKQIPSPHATSDDINRAVYSLWSRMDAAAIRSTRTEVFAILFVNWPAPLKVVKP